MSITSKPLPKNQPRSSSSAAYEDANKAIEFLCRAFGFEVLLKVDGEGGRVEHSELGLGGGIVMIGDPKAEKGRDWYVPPSKLGGANTQVMMFFVDDVDAHCARARAAGATIFMEPTTSDYGDDYWSDRSYGAVDIGGHHWWFVTRVRDKK
jgi:uncharacterized glyoxalase superfamily protein PhnB